MPLSSSATVVIMTEVVLVMAAEGSIMSTVSPSSPVSSMPNSSTNMVRVPDPLSRV